VSLSVTELISQRTNLVIVIATCTSARTPFEAADNAVECEDLNPMTERSGLRS
jgi:hypothetical protein